MSRSLSRLGIESLEHREMPALVLPLTADLGLNPAAVSLTAALGDTAAVDKEVDLYKIDLSSGGRLTATTSRPAGAAALDTYLRLFDANGNQLAYDDDSAGSYYSRLTFTATAAGPVYLGVSEYRNRIYLPATGGGSVSGGTGAYGLTVEAVPPAPLSVTADLGRPVGSSALAGVIGDSPAGNKEVELFTVELLAGATLTATTSQPAGAAAFDTYLRLFDATGRAVASDDDSAGNYYSRFSFTATAAGTYLLGVSGYGNHSYNPLTSSGLAAGRTGAYALAVQTTGNAPQPVTLVGRDIVVTGTNAADDVTVRASGNQYVVEFTTGGVITSLSFASSAVDRVRATLAGGDDSFENATSLAAVVDGGNGRNTLFGGNGTVALLGGADQDRLLIGTGVTVADGGAGDDFFEIQDTSRGSGTLTGGAGTDWVFAGGRSMALSDSRLSTPVMSFQIGGIETAVLSGSDGADTLDASGFSGTTQLVALCGNDTLRGGSGADYLSGDDGDDALFGGGGDDSLDGGAGSDTLTGGSGNDVYQFGTTVTPERDVVVELENGGTDRLDFGGVGKGTALFTVDVNLSEKYYFVAPPAGSMDPIATTPNRTVVTPTGSQIEIENVAGSQASDHLVGNSRANVLDGQGEYDWLEGGTGDTLLGGSGNDSLYIARGVALADGGMGSDYLTRVSGSRVVLTDSEVTMDGVRAALAGIESAYIEGTEGNDVLDAGGFSGGVGIDGKDGDDLLIGGHGNNTLGGGDGNDTVSYACSGQGMAIDLQAGTVVGQSDAAKKDTVFGIENVNGTRFADRISGDNGANKLWGGDGNDALDGRGGNDELYGEAGDDQLTDWSGSNRLDGGSGRTYFVTERPTGLSLAGSTERGYDDARIIFEDGSGRWSATDIAAAQRAFDWLRQITGGKTTLLKDSRSGVPLRLVMVSASDFTSIREGAVGLNTQISDYSEEVTRDIFGNITSYDRRRIDTRVIYIRERSQAYEMTTTVVHELAHNWDEAAEAGVEVTAVFRSISGWREVEPPAAVRDQFQKITTKGVDWWYLKSAETRFVSSHAKDSPLEDWAETVEQYFRLGEFGATGGLTGQPLPYQRKLDVVRAWFDSIRTGRPFNL